LGRSPSGATHRDWTCGRGPVAGAIPALMAGLKPLLETGLNAEVSFSMMW
jgi:hypothetical protein